jgi:hypothetical protein
MVTTFLKWHRIVTRNGMFTLKHAIGILLIIISINAVGQITAGNVKDEPMVIMYLLLLLMVCDGRNYLKVPMVLF